LSLAAKTGILLFKEQVPLKFKKEISAVNVKGRPFDYHFQPLLDFAGQSL
jgi:hypothetical protein